MSFMSADLGTTREVDDVAGAAGTAGVSLGTGTGQHGHTPMDLSSINPFRALFDWLNRPLTGAVSSVTVFLIVGAVLVSVLAWNIILYHIRIAAESL